jgi:hypothetical protein
LVLAKNVFSVKAGGQLSTAKWELIREKGIRGVDGILGVDKLLMGMGRVMEE